MFCTNCGFQVPDGTGFCTNCGANLKPEAPVAPPAPVAEPTVVMPAVPMAPAPVMEKKPSSKAALWIILGVLLAAGVTVAILLLFTDVFKEKKTSDSMPVAPYAGNESDPGASDPNQSLPVVPGMSDNVITLPTESDSIVTLPTESEPTTTLPPSTTTTTTTTKRPTTTTTTQPDVPELSPDNPYAGVYQEGVSYIFANSASRKLTAADLKGKTLEELCIARNEIYARHGYVFSDENLLEYFQQFSWYSPKGQPGDLSGITLSSTEIANVDAIKARENELKNGEEDFEIDEDITLMSNGKFQVNIPLEWDSTAWVEIEDDRISFYERESNEDGWGGHLVTIALYTDLEYQNIAKYRTLGELTDTSGNHWYVAAWFPTDVQFSEDAAETYMEMEAEVDAVLATLKACNGYTLNKH